MKIAAYGFAEDQTSKLSRILKLSKTHSYDLVEFDPAALPDLLLVFGEANLDGEPIQALPAGYQSRLVLVDRLRPSQARRPQISYPLISSRVLQALDKVTSANEEYVEVENEADATAEEQEDRYQKYIEADAATAEPAAEPAAETRSGYRVLVVDDSKPMQQALAGELNSHFEQIDIDFADDGSIALERVGENRYDFIFLDIMMPGIDGFETCTQMRKIPALKKTPIIMLSSKTSPLDEVKGIMAGSSTYLTKPIESSEFQKVVGRIRRWVDNFSTH